MFKLITVFCLFISFLLFHTLIILVKPKVDGNPADVTCLLNETAKLNVKFTATPKANVTWHKVDGTEIKPDDHFQIITDDNGQSTLIINNATLQDSQSYTARATHKVRFVDAKVNLNVKEVKPTLKNDLEPQTINAGDQLIYRLLIDGRTTPTVKFYKDGNEVGLVSIEQSTTPGDTTITAIFRISKAATIDQGEYQTFIENSAGVVTTKAVKVTVQQVPVFLKTPEDASVSQGKDVTYEAQLSAFPIPKVTWLLNGKPLAPNADCSITFDSTTQKASLTLREIDVDKHSGIITCQIENSAGKITRDVKLDVFAQPKITKPLKDESIIEEQDVTLFSRDNRALIAHIIRSNNAIKQSTTDTVAQFLTLHKEFSDVIASTYTHLGTIKGVADVFLPEEKMKVLNEFKTFEQVQLVVCGYNCSGKTCFLNHLLGIDAFLPTGIGSVVRIVQLSYAPAEEACLLIHEGGVDSSVMIGVDLSKYFLSTNRMTAQEKRKHLKELRAVIKQHMGRPEGLDPFSNEFAEWASRLIEIRIPSPVLQVGIIVYDTPGFLRSDPHILVKNLQDLIRAQHPSLLFLYDSPIVPDDSRQCFDALKSCFGLTADVSVFFLNTKTDVIIILHDAGEDELPEQGEIYELLENARVRRYELLRMVSEMNSDLPEQLSDCDCFDIFSVRGSKHPMEQIMTTNAIHRIVTFAVKHDLRNTEEVSLILLDMIATFFDFLLVTNPRSTEQWEKLREEALLWVDNVFQKYSLNLDIIAKQAERQLPIEFLKHRDNLAKRAEEYGQSRMPETIVTRLQESFWRKLSYSSRQNKLQEFITSTVRNEILKPTLNKMINETNSRVKMDINQQGSLSHNSSKNELIVAIYRDFLNTVENIIGSDLDTAGNHLFDNVIIVNPLRFSNYLSFLVTESGRLRRKPSQELELFHEIEHELIHAEHNLAPCIARIKVNVQKRLSENKNQFKKKVTYYANMAMKTVDYRRKTNALAREYASQFARIECRLVANLDLARHNGMKPCINIREELSRNAFFSIHPVSWDCENDLVAKIIRNPIAHSDVAYLEAHFYRTVANLKIEHTIPLRYLYEEDNKLFILLPRYRTSLHDFLRIYMVDVTMDKAIQIVLDISRVVAHMHSYELVHQNIKAQNILLDDNEQVYLADFGTCQHGTESSTVVGSRPFAPELTTDSGHDFTYKSSGVDIYALDVLMYVVAPKQSYSPITQPITQAHINELVNISSSYLVLMRCCLITEAEAHPKAPEVVKELEKIADQIADSTPCLMCLDQKRYARCLPCRHKTLCNVCLSDIERRATAERPPQCILCRQPITGAMKDADGNTYMP